jgi:7-cyano-7-deazaguanine synthase
VTTDPAIVLVSGGLDSCVTAAVAAREHGLALLHCTYGQRTADRERAAFEAIARHLGARETRVVDLSHLGRLGGSSLTDPGREVETGTSEPGVIPSTYVPFRNTHLLSTAVSWAEVTGIRKIFIGAVESDSAGYPDCRPAYYDAFNRLVRVGTREGAIEVVTPLIDKSKGEIVRLGRELGAPLHLTWSCYVRNDLACGRCESCTLRRRGFEEAGVPDPVPCAGGEDDA